MCKAEKLVSMRICIAQRVSNLSSRNTVKDSKFKGYIATLDNPASSHQRLLPTVFLLSSNVATTFLLQLLLLLLLIY